MVLDPPPPLWYVSPPCLFTPCHFPWRKQAQTSRIPFSEASKAGFGGGLSKMRSLPPQNRTIRFPPLCDSPTLSENGSVKGPLRLSAVPKRGRSKRGQTQKHANARKRAKMSSKERRCKSAKECKRAQKGQRELLRKNCKQPGYYQQDTKEYQNQRGT